MLLKLPKTLCWPKPDASKNACLLIAACAEPEVWEMKENKIVLQKAWRGWCLARTPAEDIPEERSFAPRLSAAFLSFASNLPLVSQLAGPFGYCLRFFLFVSLLVSLCLPPPSPLLLLALFCVHSCSLLRPPLRLVNLIVFLIAPFCLTIFSLCRSCFVFPCT